MNDFHCRFGVDEFADDSRAGLFKCFVRFPKVLRLFLKVFAQIFDRCDVVDALVARENADYLVVHLSVVGKFHSADNANFRQASGNERFGNLYDLDIKRVVIEVPCLRDSAVRKGVGK